MGPLVQDLRYALRFLLKAPAFMDPTLPVFDARTMKTLLAERRAPEHSASIVLDLFGTLALLLTSIGVYGVMAYAVERRTREIGVRAALGAKPHDVMRLLMQEGASLAVIGVTFGLLAAIGTTQAFSSFAGIEPPSATLLAGVSALVAGSMLAACWLPARRALRLDATVTLRVE